MGMCLCSLIIPREQMESEVCGETTESNHRLVFETIVDKPIAGLPIKSSDFTDFSDPTLSISTQTLPEK
jgi:hypothetical protein